MKTSKNPPKRQGLLLIFFSLMLIVSCLMIYLGATQFRSMLPFFQLLDGFDDGSSLLAEKPDVNPGVTDLEPFTGVRLYMLLGTDYRPEAGFRTDTIILVAVDGSSGTASMVSFPRDLWVTIPGYGEQRINTVMQTGGFQLLANTLQTNFGVYPTQYAMIDMQGFMEVVDVLGGIDVTTDQYTGDACETYLNSHKWCEVYPGTVRMDRDWALWYVRARYSSSDFDRMRRNQEVLKAIFDKAITPGGLLKTPQLMEIFNSRVDSNINPDQILTMAKFAKLINSNEDVRRFTIGPNETTSWITPMGANVLLPNVAAIQAVLQEALTFD
ncbi:MAG: LCP family protein [Chloroflexi bacterium]|nr:LCP family protein [Chloroflexota bacterium]